MLQCIAYGQTIVLGRPGVGKGVKWVSGGEKGNICNTLNNKDDFLKGMKKNAECLLLVFAYGLSIEWKIDINFFLSAQRYPMFIYYYQNNPISSTWGPEYSPTIYIL